MASHLVDKMAAAHLLEAVRSTVGHLSRARLNVSGPESEEGKSLAQLYARTRRLLQFVERAFDTYEDPIPVEIGAGDQNLLASCLLMEFGAAVVKLRRPNGKQSEEGFIRAKLQLLRHWIAAFATRQLGSIPGDPNAAEPEVKAVAHEVMTALGVQREVNMCFGAAPGAWEKDGEHGGGGVRSPVTGAMAPGGGGRGAPQGRPPAPGPRPPHGYGGGRPAGPGPGGMGPGGMGPGAMGPGGMGPGGMGPSGGGPRAPAAPPGRGAPRPGGPPAQRGVAPGAGYPQAHPGAPMPGGGGPSRGGRPMAPPSQPAPGRPPHGHGAPPRPGVGGHHGYHAGPGHRPAGPQGYAAPPVHDPGYGGQPAGSYGHGPDDYAYAPGHHGQDPQAYGYPPDGYGYAPEGQPQAADWDDQAGYDDPQGYDDPRGYHALSTDEGAIRRYLLDPNRLRDPRLRTLMSLDLDAWARSLDASDLRLAAVHLLSVLEGAVLDHVVPRAARLGLRGGPDTWRLQELLVAILPQVAPADRGRLAMLERCQNLVRPARQLREPMVVTEGILADLAQFVIRVLTELGFRGEDD